MDPLLAPAGGPLHRMMSPILYPFPLASDRTQITNFLSDGFGPKAAGSVLTLRFLATGRQTRRNRPATQHRCARVPRTPSHAKPPASVAASCSSPATSVVMLCSARWTRRLALDKVKLHRQDRSVLSDDADSESRSCPSFRPTFRQQSIWRSCHDP